MLRLTDLREILRYVPRFRDRVFVIALDGVIVAEENFRNILLDVALLRSLRIHVALVHGTGHQIQKLAAETGQDVSNLDGTGVTDAATMELALRASNCVTHEILEGLSTCDLRGANGNAVVAHPAGILRGAHQELTGRVERVDVKLLRALIDNDVVPVIPPLGCDGEGNTYRLNSDAVAVEVALSLQAVKLIFLTNAAGVVRGDTLLRQLSVDEAEDLVRDHSDEIPPHLISKLRQASRAARRGVPRVHVIDGRVEEGLLAEVFSNQGIGTLIHANEYRSIRQARKKDVREICALIEEGVANEELMQRERSEIEAAIDDFYVFEVDGAVVACVALHRYPDEGKAEIACACVSSGFENHGIGTKLIQYVEGRARQLQARELFCLSTQAYNFFVHKAGFAVATPDSLPPARRAVYDQRGRRSLVLVKSL